VRVERNDGATVQGTVAARDDSTLRLDRGARPLAVDIQSIVGLERYQGRATHIGAGFVIGGGAGFAVGFVVAMTQWANQGGFLFGESSDPDLTPAMLGLAAGGAVGILIGHGMEYESWQRVPLDRVGVDVEPTRDGVRAGVFWNR